MTCYARRISMEGSKLEDTYADLLAMVVFAEGILYFSHSVPPLLT